MKFPNHFRLSSAAVLALAMSQSLVAMEFKLADTTSVSVSPTITFGTSWRTNSPEPEIYGNLSAARVGLPAGQLGGNSGGNSLNFSKGEALSTVVKGLFDFELKHDVYSINARLKAWYDQELNEGSRAYGNIPNKFAQGVPLSDAGFNRDAKFQGAHFTDVYARGSFKFGANHGLDVRAGRQVVSWGAAQMIGGGLNNINAVDLAAAARPGFLPEETRVSTGMIYANFFSGQRFGVEGFVPYEFKPNVLNGCGTYFAAQNYVPQGCNYVSVLGAAGVNDPTALSTGRYPKRADDVMASDNGQWGVSGRFVIPQTGGDVRLYAMNTHSRAPFLNVINPNISGGYGANAVARLTDPNGIKYQVVYPEDIKQYGASFNTPVATWARVYGEYSYRPDQPIAYNASDMIAAFLNRTTNSALQLSRNVLAVAPGASFAGYERFGVGVSMLGFGFALPKVPGVDRLTAALELGHSSVKGLPDPGVLRFGRSDDYGLAQITGGAACTDTTPARKACALDGFVTGSSWGWRTRLAATFNNVLAGSNLTASLFYAKDEKGYAYTPIFVEGRWTVRPGLRFDWTSAWLDLQYTHTGGGTYNTQVDRDFASVAVGFRF